MIGRCENASGKQFAILVAGRDHVFLWSLVHRQDVLVFVDDGIADHAERDNHATRSINSQKFIETAILAQRIEMFADMRLKNIEVAVDQFGRAITSLRR